MTDQIFDVRIIPRASRSTIVGLVNGVLKIRIAAPPVDGAANEELIKMLAKGLQVPRSSVEILSGATSRMKRIRVTGASQAAIEAVLRP